MNILGRLRYFFKNMISLTDPKAWDRSLWNLFGSQALSGENVTEHTALTYAPVWNAVSIISGTIAALPLHLMQRKEDSKRIADDLPAYRVLHDQANPFMTAMAFREVMTAHVLTWGNCYAEKVRDGYGNLRELWPITPNRVRIRMENGNLVYRVRVGNDNIDLPREIVLHVPGLGFDGFQGYSVIAMARKSIGLGVALESFGSLFFGNGTNPGMVVSHPQSLSAQAKKNIEDSLGKQQSGLGKAHRLMVLEEGMKVEKYGIPPDDCQFLETRGFQIPDIARWFNLPPHKLKDLSKSSFSNIESEQTSFVIDTLLPWLVRFEQNYNMQLLTPSERALSGRGRLYFKHIVEGLLRGDHASRATFYKEMFMIGAMSQNDIREREDMDPIDGGDKYYVPLNMVAVEDVGKEPAPPPVIPGRSPAPAPKRIPMHTTKIHEIGG